MRDFRWHRFFFYKPDTSERESLEVRSFKERPLFCCPRRSARRIGGGLLGFRGALLHAAPTGLLSDCPIFFVMATSKLAPSVFFQKPDGQEWVMNCKSSIYRVAGVPWQTGAELFINMFFQTNMTPRKGIWQMIIYCIPCDPGVHLSNAKSQYSVAVKVAPVFPSH